MIVSRSDIKAYNKAMLLEYKKSKAANKKRLEKIRQKEKISILFLVIFKQMWKMDALYKAMQEDPLFNPKILIIPALSYHKDDLHDQLNDNVQFFTNKGYNVESSFDVARNQWKSISEFKPDILFFSNPHPITHDKYYEKAFRNYISCYIPYYHQTGKWRDYIPQYNRLFHNMMWKIFAPSEVSLDIHQQFSASKGDNVEVTGYVACEPLLEAAKSQPWKFISDGKKRKRIIWAPHHTFDDLDNQFSTFHLYHDFFKELAVKYKSEVQFAFKPHPLLKPKLDAHKDWGKEKADEYYEFWESQENTQLENADYEDLFITSDALIHDCTSFLAEYHYTNHPVLFLWRSENTPDALNKLGKEAIKSCVKGMGKEDISSFIDSLINGNIKWKCDFYEKNLKKLLQEKPSKKITQTIKNYMLTQTGTC